LHQRVEIDRPGVEDRDAALLEQVRHAAARAEIAPVLGQHVADLADGAVLVVRQRLDVDRRSAGPVALVHHLFERGAVAASGALLDRALDRVLGHVRAPRLVDGQAQPRVRVGIAAADPGRRADLADQLREDLPALRVRGALLALDRGPAGMAGHTQLPGNRRGLARVPPRSKSDETPSSRPRHLPMSIAGAAAGARLAAIAAGIDLRATTPR